MSPKITSIGLTKVTNLLRKNTTAMLAAASVTLGTIGGATIKDNFTAYKLNSQVEDLQQSLVDDGVNQEVVDQLEFQIEKNLDKNTSWYESRTSKAVKRAFAWQAKLDSLAAEGMAKFAYKKGVQDAFDYFSSQSDRIDNNILKTPNIK